MLQIHAPCYRLEGRLYPLSAKDSLFEDDRFTVHEFREDLGDLQRIRRCWTNCSEHALEFQPIFEAETSFIPDELTIPCVSLNGNHWGHGKEPKGFQHDGVPMVFAGSRTSIPACTVSERADTVCALFASEEDESSLSCSCSVFQTENGHAIHRILYPVIEEPLSYIDRDTFGPAYKQYVRIGPGEDFSATVYCYTGKPTWPHYGTAAVVDAVTNTFSLRTQSQRSRESLWHLGIRFTKSLALPVNDAQPDGDRLLCIGFGKDGPLGEYLPVHHFEIGWCGQNLTYARMLIRDAAQYGHEDSLQLALSILDTWRKSIVPTGLLAVHYQKRNTPEGDIADTCNLGGAALEFLRCYQTLLESGIHKPELLQAAQGICDFFVSQRDGSTGFGKSWSISRSECLDNDGTVGAFVVQALLEMYRFTGNEKYLLPAERAFVFYDTRDLQHFRCMAGALDTDCIDKETAGPMLLSALLLYDIKKEKRWLDAALRAASYFSSWMYCYDVPAAPNSDFARYDFHTTGATAVSVQHHHVDAWGVYLVPAFLKLSELTGDMKWSRRAKAMWDCYTVCVADEETWIHGTRRPVGSQNEGWMHTRWNNRFQDPQPGTMNDWLVAWPTAFRLATIDALRGRPDPFF